MKDGNLETSAIDTSAIFVNEYFTYLGKLFVKKLMNEDLKNAQGETVHKIEILPDGHKVNGIALPGPSWDVFHELKVVRADSPDVIRQFGKPITTQIIPSDQLTAKEVFKYEGEEIRYKNMDLAELVLVKKGNKIVIESGEVKKSRYAKELGYWK